MILLNKFETNSEVEPYHMNQRFNFLISIRG